MNDFKWLFVSEIKGIQDYILNTDKLRHIVGASEIIANITEELYKKVLTELECKEVTDYKVMMAAAGRLMILFSNKEKLDDFMLVWPIVIKEYAPGVELVYDYFDADPNNLQESRKTALEKMNAKRQQPVCSLPIPSLLTERSRRDGLAAIVRDKKEGPISIEIKRKLDIAKSTETLSNLIKKFVPDSNEKYSVLEQGNKWPIDFEDITGFNDKSYMAVVHIDVNSMGIFFRELGKQLNEKDAETTLIINNDISEKLLEAAKESVQAAVQTLIEENNELEKILTNNKKFPLRPLVLAGDDLTFVIKATYAVRFSESYMFNFSNRAKQKLQEVFNTHNIKLDENVFNLKLSAGITFTKSKFPFKSAYELCENLCKKGKELSERKFSTISFYRQTTATSDNLDSLFDREFKHKYPNNTLKLTYKSYALNENEKLPFIKDLTDIVSLLNKLPRGSLRKMASKMFLDKDTVDTAWNRFVEICSARAPKVVKNLKEKLQSITKNKETPLWESKEGEFITPLVDAINLHSVTSNFDNETEDGGDEQ